jgi:hypothetical protein
LFFADVLQTENITDEYLAGIRTDVPFTANEYRSVYETRLKYELLEDPDSDPAA